MTTIQFTVPGIPIPQPRQRHRIAGGGKKQWVQNYTPRDDPVQTFKATVIKMASEIHCGPPLLGPITFTAIFVYTRLNSMKRPGRACKPTKPDWDNAGKSLADALTGLVWKDDAQLCSVQVMKLYADATEQPHVEVTIKELEHA
jgi:Holliday junction resolvase RusA-like endonuclease